LNEFELCLTPATIAALTSTLGDDATGADDMNGGT
jgi:hypothetical protein